MLLCIDIGNSNIKLGLFEGAELKQQWRLATERLRLADEYAVLLLNLLSGCGLNRQDLSGCAISSVVPALTQEFSELSRRHLQLEPVVLGKNARTGMKVNTDYPAEVGVDLITNAVAARALYGAPVIVIGMGTATTLSAVSAGGDFEGVAIAPGISTGAEALFRFAAQLPQVELARPPHAIGKNTVHSIQSGLVWGFAALVEGLVRRMQVELGGQVKVVATGGLAELIAHETPAIDVVEPNLNLIGLRMIYELNQEN